jgi:hypothetical protein
MHFCRDGAMPGKDNVSICRQEKKEGKNNVEGLIYGKSWRSVYDALHSEIKIRHYSPKTLKTYTLWIRQFQAFTKSKDTQLLSSTDVKEFLSYLATKRNVSASTQNQAFNALWIFD